MPVYLVHGFRWPREGFTGIRVHAVVHNLDNCSVEYIQNQHSRAEILASFRKAWPEIMNELDGPGAAAGSNNSLNSKLEFIEQYNPDDLDGPYAVSQPYAYVADKVVMIAANPGTSITASPTTPTSAGSNATVTPATVAAAGYSTPPVKTTPSKKQPVVSPRAPTTPTVGGKTAPAAAPFTSPAAPDVTALSVNVDEVVAEGPGTSAKAWEAFADLRDKLAEGEKIGWWIVYNGDPERSYDEDFDVDMDEEGDGEQQHYDEEVGVEHDDAGINDGVRLRAQQQQQQQAVPRPRTAPGDNTNITTTTARTRQPVPGSVPHISTQHQQNLTALPVRPGPPAVLAPATRADKGKQKETIPEPTKLKETAKSQGLRKKFFGKRL